MDGQKTLLLNISVPVASPIASMGGCGRSVKKPKTTSRHIKSSPKRCNRLKPELYIKGYFICKFKCTTNSFI